MRGDDATGRPRGTCWRDAAAVAAPALAQEPGSYVQSRGKRSGPDHPHGITTTGVTFAWVVEDGDIGDSLVGVRVS